MDPENVNASESNAAALYASQQQVGNGAVQYDQLVQSQLSSEQVDDPNCRSLYVGNLDPRVTDEMLRDIFSTVATVISVKIIPDKHVGCSFMDMAVMFIDKKFC